jgi:hypothetical protein
VFWLRYLFGLTAHEVETMPLWELDILNERAAHWLPHILYGLDGASSQKGVKRGSDPASMPGMVMG